MWPFKRKKANSDNGKVAFLCSYCRSSNTRVKTGYGSEQGNYIRTWRGQRFVTCRCLDCGKDFYAEEPREGFDIEEIIGNEIVEDEEALRDAEDELRRQADEDNDRRCR